MIDFFQNLFGNAGAFLVDIVKSLYAIAGSIPGWLYMVIAAIIAVMTVRIVINVF